MHSDSTSFQGIFVALATPMDEEQNVDLPSLEKLVEHLIQAGVHGLVPLGSSGEYYALDDEERRAVLQTVVEVAGGRVPVVAGCTAGSTRKTVQLAEYAQKIGCQGIMLSAPFYALPRPHEIRAYYEAVDRAIDIPIIIYNYPTRVGVDITPELALELAELKNVRFIKESTGQMDRANKLLNTGSGKLEVFCGCDTLALQFLLTGAIGWISGISNFLPELHVQLFSLVKCGKYQEAQELFFAMLPLHELIENGGQYIQYVKLGCKLRGMSVGPPRLPLMLPDSSRAEFFQSLLKPLLARIG